VGAVSFLAAGFLAAGFLTVDFVTAGAAATFLAAVFLATGAFFATGFLAPDGAAFALEAVGFTAILALAELAEDLVLLGVLLRVDEEGMAALPINFYESYYDA
jgi:hypothetical protein